MSERQHHRILNMLETRPWAIWPLELERLYSIVTEPQDLEAVAAKLGRPLENTGGQVTMRGQTAILELSGPIFRYANLMTDVSGATSVQMAAIAFDAALDNPGVARIVLNVNSLGGQVDGINAFADQIRAGSERKPVIAYIDGTGYSAAYWLAAAAPRIVAEENSFVGSIGVVATHVDRSGAQERQGIRAMQVVSSQSPRKRQDPFTGEGRQQLQDMVDIVAELFIGRVAQFRGVSPETVMEQFGAGGVLSAPNAKAVGMIDAISPFEPFLRSLNEQRASVFIPAAPAAQLKEVPMDPATALPASTAVAPSPPTTNVLLTTGNATTTGNTGGNYTSYGLIAAPAPTPTAEEERERIRAILTSPEAAGREELARVLAFEPPFVDPAFARKMLGASAQQLPPAATTTNGFAAAMDRLPNPVVGISTGVEDDSAAAEAARILAHVAKERKFN